MLSGMIEFFRKVKRAVDMTDVFVFSGIGCVGYGLSQIYPPSAWVVVGISLFWLGVRR